MGSPVPGRHPKSTHTLLLEVPSGRGSSGVRLVSSLGWPVLPGRARVGSLAPWAALSLSSFAKSAQGKLFSWQGPPVTCPILMGKAWPGVTPRAGPKPLSLSYHSWAAKHSALRPEGQEEGRMQGFPAAKPSSSSWMETPSLGDGISKVQSKKGEGTGRVMCSRKLPDMAPEPAQQICCVAPPPAHLTGTGETAVTWASCAVWHVGVQPVAGQVLSPEVGFCDGQVAVHRVACSVVSVMGFNASRHPTTHVKIPHNEGEGWYVCRQSQMGSVSWWLSRGTWSGGPWKVVHVPTHSTCDGDLLWK